MRTIGFVLVLLGLVTIYLATKGKIGAALSALLTGQAPSATNNNDSSHPSALPGAPTYSSPPGLKGPSGQITVPNDPYTDTGGISQ